MVDKFLHQLQEGAQSYPDDSKKRKQVIQKLQPIEYFDLIPPAEEEETSNNESEDDCRQIFFIKRKNKIPKKTEKNRDNHLIKDLIINKEEPIAKADNQDTWEFAEAEDFFRQKIQVKENTPGSQPKF